MVDRWPTSHGGVSKAERAKRARLLAELEPLTRTSLTDAEQRAIGLRVRRGKVAQTFFRRGAALMGDG